MAKILIWDIETSGLVADFGRIYCIGYKWVGKPKVYIDSVERFGNERALIKHFVEEVYSEADITVAYNGKRFDLPYTQTKYSRYFDKALPPIPMVDPYYTFKHKMRLSRKSLQSVCDYLELKNSKEGVSGRLWFSASGGNLRALRNIIRHCRADIRVLDELYIRIRKLIATHPRVAPPGFCRVCGSSKLRAKGWLATKNKTPQIKALCGDCGAWDTITVPRLSALRLDNSKGSSLSSYLGKMRTLTLR